MFVSNILHCVGGFFWSYLQQISVQDLQAAAGAHVLAGGRHGADGGGRWAHGGSGRCAGGRAGVLPLHVGPLGLCVRVRLQQKGRCVTNTQPHVCVCSRWCRLWFYINFSSTHGPARKRRTNESTSEIAEKAFESLTIGADLDSTLQREAPGEMLWFSAQITYKTAILIITFIRLTNPRPTLGKQLPLSVSFSPSLVSFSQRAVAAHI